MTPRAINTADWWAGLAAAGLPRGAVEALVVAVTQGGAVVDPHRLTWDVLAAELQEAEALPWHALPLLVAAGRVLHHQEHPGYGAMMYLRMASWRDADASLRAWIIEQYGAMIAHGPEPVAESAWYSLGVDFCEDHEDGAVMLPGLLPWLSTQSRLRLLRLSVAARWSARRGLMRWALEDTSRHGLLAEHIGKSAFSGFFGSFDVADARRIARRLTGLPAKQQAWLDARLSATLHLPLIGVAVLEGRVCIALAWRSFAPSWFGSGTEISLNGQPLGTVQRFRVSMARLDPAGLDRAVIPTPRPEAAAQWHHVTGSHEAWASAAGQVVTVRAGT